MLEPYDINLRHLNAIRAIAERGGVSRAAETVFLSQPAITQGLAKLEQGLETPLFDRQATGMTPTEAGRILIERAGRAFDHLAEGARTLRAAAGGQTAAPIDRLVSMIQLRALIAVVMHGGFAPAARATGLSEPALHRSTRELERLSGAALLIRRGRTVSPTPSAEKFVRQARLAVAEISTALGELAALQGRKGARVVIGAMPLARARLAPRAVNIVHKALPQVTFAIVEGPYPELLAGLRAGDIDLLIGALRDPAPADDVVEEALFIDQAVIAARSGHPLSSPLAPEVAALRLYPWVIAREGSPLRRVWEAMFTDGAGPPEVTVECGSMMAINALLREGDWLTLISPEQIRREREAGWLEVIGPPVAHARRPIGLTTRKGWLPSRPQARLIEVLRELSRETSQN